MIADVRIIQRLRDGGENTLALSDFGITALKDSLKDLFAVQTYNNIQTQKWAEYSGEDVNFRLATLKEIKYSLKVFGDIENVRRFSEGLFSIGRNTQRVEVDVRSDGAVKTLYIPSEFVKASGIRAMSVDGDVRRTYASITLDFEVVASSYAKGSYDNFAGILSDWTQNGALRKKTLRKSAQGAKYYFYEIDKDAERDLRNGDGIDDVYSTNDICLGSLGFSVLKGYYQSAYSPAEQNDALKITGIGHEEQRFRLNSDRKKAKDVQLKIVNQQEGIEEIIYAVGRLKRWLHRVLKHSDNSIVFCDDEGVLFKCYVKACSVSYAFNFKLIEMTLTLRAYDFLQAEDEEGDAVIAPSEPNTPVAPPQTPPTAPDVQDEEIEINDVWTPFLYYTTTSADNNSEQVVLKKDGRVSETARGKGLKVIPKGSLVSSIEETTKGVYFIIPIVPCFETGMNIVGQVTEEITEEDFTGNTWREKIRLGGVLGLPYKLWQVWKSLNISPAFEEVKWVRIPTQQMMDTHTAHDAPWEYYDRAWREVTQKLKDEARGDDSMTWNTYFKNDLWYKILLTDFWEVSPLLNVWQ